MKTKHSKLWPLIALSLIALISCQQQAWYEHFEDSGRAGSEKTMMEYIESEPQLDLFLQMLQISSYDTVLSVAQTYTVWAPQNEALSGIDLSDTALVREIVSNHISRYAITTSDSRSEKIYMFSNKLVSFVGDKFGETNLTTANIKVTNGLLHIIDAYVPYVPNIWEYIGRIPDLDSMALYLESQNQRIFNLLASKQIGTNADNQPIYDSAFYNSNRFLSQIAPLNSENSTLTALLPTNEAWHKSFNRIKDYFKTTVDDGGWAKQKELSQLMMVKDLIYNGNFKKEGFPDSIRSTVGSYFNNVSELFQGSNSFDASNGVIYLSDSLRFPATRSWHKEIVVEAENNYYGRSTLNAQVYNRTSAGTAFTTSSGRYLEVEATGTTILSKTYVDFPIPNVLSAKYNIYCVFVPESIVNSINPKSNVVNIALSYVDSEGRMKNNISMQRKVTTKAEDTTKVFVTQMDFAYSNIMYMNSSINDIKVKLRVENAVTASQTRLYTRTMRIDCVLFEPVED